MALAGGEMPADRPHDGRDISQVLFGTGPRPDSEFYANYIDPWTEAVGRSPRLARGGLAIVGPLSQALDFNRHFEELGSVPACPAGVAVRDLGGDCREVAETPRELFAKLDDWGFDSLVIPHGLAWGTTNPLDGDF